MLTHVNDVTKVMMIIKTTISLLSIYLHLKKLYINLALKSIKVPLQPTAEVVYSSREQCGRKMNICLNYVTLRFS